MFVRRRIQTTPITIRDFVRLPFLFFSILGIKLFLWDSNDHYTRRHKITVIIMLLNLNFNYWCAVLYPLFDTFDSEQPLTQLILYSSFAHLGFFKMLSVWIGRKSLKTVLFEMNENFPKTRAERLSYRLDEHYQRACGYLNFLAIFHWTIAISFMVFPLAQSGLEYLSNWDVEDVQYKYRFPYVLTYPFDHRQPVGYIVAFTTQVMVGATVSLFFSGSDLLLIGIVYVILMKFEFLNRRILRFESKSYEEDMKEIKEMLQYHANLHYLADKINSIFSISILFNYIISIIVLVLIGLNMLGGTNFFSLIKFVGFLSSSLIQVYYFCLFGTKLLTSSNSIVEAWCGHSWYNAHPHYQRMLFMAILRAQRPARLTAFKFFDLSMGSFKTLMTTSYQFFTLLKTRIEDNM